MNGYADWERPDYYAQGQVALYEQMLSALQSNILAIKASGTAVTSRVMAEARNDFQGRVVNTLRWMEHEEDRFNDSLRTFVLNDREVESYGEAWHVWYWPVMLMASNAFGNAVSANRQTYLSSLKFGSAFGGLSDLLKDMHGSMGYLVQKQSMQVRWNVRGSDGRTLNTLRYIYPFYRLEGVRAIAMHMLLRAESDDIRKVRILDKNDQVLLAGAPKDLLKQEVAEKYFNFGSENSIAF